MTDAEFDVLDALYFVTPFAEVVEESGLPVDDVKETLKELISRGWVRVSVSPGQELLEEDIAFHSDFDRYHYLATKEGLLAHNGR